MRYFLSIIALISIVNGQAQTKAAKPAYDSLLAKRTGADSYGMKHYVLAILKPGKAKVDSAESSRLQLAHLKNIQRLAEEKKLVVAGPFLDRQNMNGLFVFNVATLEEARALADSDPAVKAGIFELELHPWYCSAALVEVPELHKKLQKKSFTE